MHRSFWLFYHAFDQFFAEYCLCHCRHTGRNYTNQHGKPATFLRDQKKKTSGALKQETKKLLVDFYRPQIEELAKMLGDEKFLWKDGSFS